MKTLNWADLRALGKTDSAQRWTPRPEIKDYFDTIRSPSRAYPHSYARAAMTKKFSRWLTDHHPELASQVGLTPTEEQQS